MAQGESVENNAGELHTHAIQQEDVRIEESNVERATRMALKGLYIGRRVLGFFRRTCDLQRNSSPYSIGLFGVEYCTRS